MRFSSAFQHPLPVPRTARRQAAGREETPATLRTAPARLPQDLPDELDARVRLVGEWQLGED